MKELMKLKDERRGTTLTTTRVKLLNWIARASVPGTVEFRQYGKEIFRVMFNREGAEVERKLFYTVLGTETKASTPWAWKLVFWVHDTWEGDDCDCVVKFRGPRPTDQRIAELIRKAWKKESMEGDEGNVFKNMKDDWQLVDLATNKVVATGTGMTKKPAAPAVNLEGRLAGAGFPVSK